ncbi:MAG: hypothetical protein IJB59_03655, partial [Oscillospiraceae bacterium]|nr:hypothetical protein [Oscillospiraceae bacterium]
SPNLLSFSNRRLSSHIPICISFALLLDTILAYLLIFGRLYLVFRDYQSFITQQTHATVGRGHDPADPASTFTMDRSIAFVSFCAVFT